MIDNIAEFLKDNVIFTIVILGICSVISIFKAAFVTINSDKVYGGLFYIVLSILLFIAMVIVGFKWFI